MSTQKASSKPPILDGTNYPLWSLRMRAYISAQHDFAWEAVEHGWNPPVVQEVSFLGEIVSKPKPKESWTELELKLSMGNSKALNAIFGAVDQEQFERICEFDSAKEAWDKLQHVNLIHQFSDSSDLLLDRVDQKLSFLSERSNYQSIYKFLLTQRKENEEAYEPEMLSIGPYHHGKAKYQKMERYKLEYFQGILKRCRKDSTNAFSIDANLQQLGPHVQQESSTYIKANLRDMLKRLEEKNDERYSLIDAVERARNCYSRDAHSYQYIDFAEMMLLDGCFIIEFLRKYSMGEKEWKNDSVFKMKCLVEILCRDMLLFENQIPFFILQLLFDMTKIEGRDENLIDLAISCLNHCVSFDSISVDNVSGSSYKENSVLHLLGLMYDSWCSSFANAQDVEPQRKNSSSNHHTLDFSDFTPKYQSLQFIKSVSELEEHGIQFSKALIEEKKEKKEEDGTTCKAIQEQKETPTSSAKSRSWLDIKFENGEMKIPTLVVQDHTESLLRNLIAYEEYMIDPRYKGKVVSDYTTLMNCLVNTAEDVKTLRDQGVVENLLGNDEALADMFNRIRPNVTLNSPWFSYPEIFRQVNEHCSKRHNRWIADLKKNYFNNPWSITAFIAATFLLVLTLLQTIFSIY